MQQTIRDYKRDEQLAQRQEEKLEALHDIRRHYQDWQQAIERWRIQSFLSRWAEKEVQQAAIERAEQAKRECEAALGEAEKQIEALATEIGQKENRQRELDRAIAQSNVYQEAERLEQQKAERVVEQKKLMDGCQKLALEIRREAGRINHICEKVMAWEKETLTPVQQAAENAKKAYTPFESAGAGFVCQAHFLSLNKPNPPHLIFGGAFETPLTKSKIKWMHIRSRLTRKKLLWLICARM